ncbi:MAG: porin [Planctomycetota bacterium]
MGLIPLAGMLSASDDPFEQLQQRVTEVEAQLKQQDEAAARRKRFDPVSQASLLDENGVDDDEEEEGGVDLVKQLSQRLAEVEKDLKKRKEADAKAAAAKKTDDVWTDVSGEKWTVKLGGHVQLDYVNWAHADPLITGPAAAPGPKDYFEFRRLRLVADGTGYGVYDFRLQMTLEPETVGETLPAGTVTSPDVKDAYFTINEIPWLGRLRIGNFFVPFSLEQVTNDTNNIFMERSIPTQGIFAADREVGVAFYNTNASQKLTWAGGAFFDSITDSLKERIDDNQGLRLSGRVTWLPYYDELSNGRYLVHTGAGVLYTKDQNNSVTFRARPQVHEGPRLISGTVLADSYTTGNVEFATVWGSFTVQSEAFVSNVNRLAGDSVNVYGAYVHGSYFLTGENRIYERFGQHGAQFGRNAPYNNVFAIPGSVSLGAWEAKTRWSYLDLSNISAGQYNDLTVGFNWYWSDRVRVMFDWIHPVTSAGTTFGSTESDLIATRFDFNW